MANETKMHRAFMAWGEGLGHRFDSQRPTSDRLATFLEYQNKNLGIKTQIRVEGVPMLMIVI